LALVLVAVVGARPALDADAQTAGGSPIAGAATATEQAERVRPPLPTPGNPNAAPIPAWAGPVDASRPDRTIGNGTPASCTSRAVVDAVARGGVIRFDCGPDPVTIVMNETAKVVNTSRVVVLDGGGLVTLSGAGQRRILYMNTCDRNQVWTTPHCQNQDHPQLTLQGLHFTNGNSTGQTVDGGGGGAVFVRGGRLKIVDSRFTRNRCESTGPDVGGAAVRVLSQYQGLPVVVARSTFGGGAADRNLCSNGGAISSIGVSWGIHASLFTHNDAIGVGANPQRPGTPGGGNGGAIYLDGNRFTLDLVDTVVTDNTANEGGGAVFFVSNDRTGELRIDGSTLRRNTSRGFETRGYPGIFFLGAGTPQVTASTIR
jgi:hypothetical protein